MIQTRYFPADSHGPRQVNVRIGRHHFALRMGRATHPLFSERNQGVSSIPRRYFYLFGGRLTFIWMSRKRQGEAA